MTATPLSLHHLDPAGDLRTQPGPRAGQEAAHRPPAPGHDRTGLISVDVLSRSAISRRGIRAMLRDHPDRVIPATTSAGRADVVLFELSANASGDQRALQYLSHQPAAVIVIAHTSHPEAVSRALELGASCCVTSEITTDALMACISLAAVGDGAAASATQAGARSPASSSVAAARAGPRARPMPRAIHPILRGEEWARGPELGARLSDREQEVISLIATGLSNTEIAETLHLGLNTVKTYIRAAYRKIGVRTRTQAVIWAISQPGPSGAEHPAPAEPTADDTLQLIGPFEATHTSHEVSATT